MLKGKSGATLFEKGTPPPPEKFETPRQRHARLAAAKKKVCRIFDRGGGEEWKDAVCGRFEMGPVGLADAAICRGWRMSVDVQSACGIKRFLVRECIR